MAGKDIIMATQEELSRLHIIRKAIDKIVTQAEAADIIGLTERQARRLVKRVRTEGDIGIIHRLRGRPSNRTIQDKLKDKALKLFQEKYNDFGPTLASEKLFEIDKIRINDETLRLWLIEKNIPYKKRKKRPHREWRQRRHHFGEMVQIDGSHHDWFEGRASKCVLMGYVDDATGNVFARFYPYEGTLPFMDSFKRYIKKYGIPQSVYIDRHTTYKSTKKPTIEEQLNNTESLSEVQRALGELSVDIIYAYSPQAKGRVERQFNTFQDRLIKEMRLGGIKTPGQANKLLIHYLPKYNKRFAKKPALDVNLHRPIPKGIDLDKIFRIKTQRTLRNDFTIAHDNKLYQIKDNIPAKKVVVEEKIDGSMEITYKDSPLRYKEIHEKPPKEPGEIRFRKIYIPPADHPFKGPMFRSRYPDINNYSQKEKVGQKEKELLLTTT